MASYWEDRNGSAENADNVDITVQLDLTDGEVYDLRVINNVLRISWPDEERAVAVTGVPTEQRLSECSLTK